MTKILAIAAGGAIGAVCRYGIALLCLRMLGNRFAYGTLAVNVLGCFAIGLLLHGSLNERTPWLSHPGLTVGFLGALTTFSTFGYETVRFFEQGDWHLALINVGANVLLGCGAVALAVLVGNSLS